MKQYKVKVLKISQFDFDSIKLCRSLETALKRLKRGKIESVTKDQNPTIGEVWVILKKGKLVMFKTNFDTSG